MPDPGQPATSHDGSPRGSTGPLPRYPAPERGTAHVDEGRVPAARPAPGGFRWGLALGVLVPLVVVGALFSPIAAFLVGVTAPLTVIVVAVTGIVCLQRGRTSRSADAVGFAVALAPILAALPLVLVVLHSVQGRDDRSGHTTPGPERGCRVPPPRPGRHRWRRHG